MTDTVTFKVLSERQSLAHKDHGICVVCREDILAGEWYRRYSILASDGSFSFLKTHALVACDLLERGQ